MNKLAKFILPTVVVIFLVAVTLIRMPQPVSAADAVITSSADMYILEDLPDTTTGFETSMYVRAGMTGHIWRSLVMFDLSPIPSGSLINSAYLSLFYEGYSGNDPAGRTYTANRVTHSWVETVDGTKGTTWNEANHDPLLHPGGCVDWANGGDWTGSGAASSMVPSGTGWMTWDVTSIVKDWIEGGQPNYGFLIRDLSGEPGGSDAVASFRPREAYPSPVLEIDWSPWTPPRPVGGLLTPVNKLVVLSPYLTLIGFVGAVTVAVAITRRRKP